MSWLVMARIGEATVVGLTNQILGAALEPERWPEVLISISDAVAGRPLMLCDMRMPQAAGEPQSREPGIALIGTVSLDPDCMQILFERFGTPDTNPAIRATIELMDRASTPRNFPEFIPDYAGLERHPVFREACDAVHRPQRIHNDTFMYARVKPAQRLALKIWRPATWDFLEAGQLKLLARLSPIIDHALAVNDLLPATSAPLLSDDWLEGFGQGALAVDRHGRILSANRCGHRVLAARDGLRSSGGLLRADCETTDSALGAMIALVQASSDGRAAMPTGILRIPRPSGCASYAVRVTAARFSGEARGGGPVLVFIERGVDPSFDMDTGAGPGTHEMRAGPIVRLSQRERQCLEGVALGRTTKRIARLLELSADTVDEHIANARRKLGARTRAEAVAIATSHALLSIPPTVGGRRNSR